MRFVLRRDRRDRFRFASLQSEFANTILQRHGIDPTSLDTVYLLLDPDSPRERLLARSDAIAEVLHEIGWLWRAVAVAAQIIPRRLRNALYVLAARNRYRAFGKYQACPLPAPADRHKFLDL